MRGGIKSQFCSWTWRRWLDLSWSSQGCRVSNIGHLWSVYVTVVHVGSFINSIEVRACQGALLQTALKNSLVKIAMCETHFASKRYAIAGSELINRYSFVQLLRYVRLLSSRARLVVITCSIFCFAATSNGSNLPLGLHFFTSTHEKKVNDTLNTLCLNSDGSLSPCWKSSHLQRGFVPANIGKLDPQIGSRSCSVDL